MAEKIDYTKEFYEINSQIVQINIKLQDLADRLAKLETVDDLGGVFTDGTPDYVKAYLEQENR